MIPEPEYAINIERYERVLQLCLDTVQALKGTPLGDRVENQYIKRAKL